MKKLILIISCISSLFATDNNTTISNNNITTNNQQAITISKQSVDDVLKEYNKTLVLIKDTEKSINEYLHTLKTSIDSLKQTYTEVSPNISQKTERIVSSIEDMNTTVNSSINIIQKNIDNYYIIEIIAFIAFLISINNILEIIIKIRRFKFIRNWLKLLTKPRRETR